MVYILLLINLCCYRFKIGPNLLELLKEEVVERTGVIIVIMDYVEENFQSAKTFCQMRMHFSTKSPKP